AGISGMRAVNPPSSKSAMISTGICFMGRVPSLRHSLPCQRPDCTIELSPSRGKRLFSQGCLGSGEASDGDAERAAAYVVQTDFVAELDGVGITAVLAADADFQVFALAPALVHTDLHERAHAVDVDRLKGIPCNDLFLGDLLT